MNTSPTQTLHPSYVLESLNWRYATKKFDPDRKIPKKTLAELFEILRLAPSSMGLQPYRFIHVQTEATRKALRASSYDQAQITDASELIVIAAKLDYTEADIEAFLHASQNARGYSNDDIEKRRGTLRKHVQKFGSEALLEWNARQAYIAIGQLLTAAAMLHIDACPMEGIIPDEYSAKLGLQQLGLQALAVVTLGYRSSDDALADQAKIRLPVHTLVVQR